MLTGNRPPFVPTLPRLDPDVALVRQFRATGDPALFEALFKKYQAPIFHLVCRMVNGEDAYDLTQDVFLRALRALPSFKGDSKFSTWLYTIARNTCLNHRREDKKRRTLDLDDEESGRPEPAAPGADVARIAETRELQRVVDAVLAQLTDEQRLLLVLRDFEQLSYEEIGEITELSLVNVKSKLHRARLAFKAKFAPYLALVDMDGEPMKGVKGEVAVTSEEVQSLFSDYVEGALDPATRDAVQAFLAENPESAAELIAFERTLALLHRLPPREPSLDLWREFAPHMVQHRAERRLGMAQRVALNWQRLLSQFSAGLILWTHLLADRTHARLERYLLHDPLPQYQRGE